MAHGMFTAALLEKLHAMPLAAALTKVEQAAGVYEVAPEDARKEYSALRIRHELPQVVEAAKAAGPVAPADSPLARALQGGAFAKVVLNDAGQPVLEFAMPGVATIGGGRGVTGPRPKYYLDGELVKGTLAQVLREKFPQSEAARIMREYQEREERGESQAKISAWNAIRRDEVLKPRFKRVAAAGPAAQE